jgi:hypothetical protein
MRVTKVKFKQIIPDKGHIGFVSLVIDDWLFLNNIAIFKRFNQSDKIRLVFPEKKSGDKKINLFYPLSSKSYFELERLIQEQIKDL